MCKYLSYSNSNKFKCCEIKEKRLVMDKLNYSLVIFLSSLLLLTKITSS